MLRIVLILLLVFSVSGCAFGPEERPGENLREKSMDWPSMRTMEKEPGPRTPQEQR